MAELRLKPRSRAAAQHWPPASRTPCPGLGAQQGSGLMAVIGIMACLFIYATLVLEGIEGGKKDKDRHITYSQK